MGQTPPLFDDYLGPSEGKKPFPTEQFISLFPLEEIKTTVLPVNPQLDEYRGDLHISMPLTLQMRDKLCLTVRANIFGSINVYHAHVMKVPAHLLPQKKYQIHGSQPK